MGQFYPYLQQVHDILHIGGSQLSVEDVSRMKAITTTVPGYGDFLQFCFFNRLISSLPIRKVLLIGVYRGRDACFILDAARHHNVDIQFIGVDKFSDDFCEDWSDNKRDLKWEEAGYGTAPNIEETRRHLQMNGFENVNLVKSKDEDYLSSCNEVFDLIYIDTAHDYKTVLRQIYQVEPLIHTNTIVCGDDYSDERERWGVVKAVKENTSQHSVFADWIWFTTAAGVSPNRRAIKKHFPHLLR